MRKIAFIFTIVLLISFTETKAQTAFGYLGKRFYLKGNLSAGPSLFSRNLEGEFWVLRFNAIGTVSANMVLNRKSVLAVNYKRYVNIASISSSGIIPSPDEAGSTVGDIGNFRFRTSEVGINHQWFNKNLDAPQGSYVSLGVGLAMSKFDTPIQYRNFDRYSGSDSKVYRFDNTQVIRSPILRLGLGKQIMFWDRFVYDFGVDIGLNTAFIGNIFLAPFNDFDGSGNVTNQEEYDQLVKGSLQRRIFFMNLVNFRMGLGILLF